MLFRKIPGHLAIAGFRFHPGFFHRFVGNHQQSSCRNLVCKACRKQGCRLHIDTGSVCTAKVVFEIAVIFPYPSVRRVDSPGPVIFPPVTYGGRDGAHHRESRERRHFCRQIFVRSAFSSDSRNRHDIISQVVRLLQSSAFPQKEDGSRLYRR